MADPTTYIHSQPTDPWQQDRQPTSAISVATMAASENT